MRRGPFAGPETGQGAITARMSTGTRTRVQRRSGRKSNAVSKEEIFSYIIILFSDISYKNPPFFVDSASIRGFHISMLSGFHDPGVNG